MSNGADSTPAISGPVEMIDHDLPCVRCGYNLRGLAEGANCPECGAVVEYSLRGDWLRYADRRWAKQVLRGLQWTMASRAAIAIAFALAITIGLVGLLAIPRDTDSAIESAFTFALGIIGGLMAILPIGIAYGLWRASAPEPREGAATSGTSLITRIASVLLVPALGLWIFAASSGWAPLGSSAPARHGLAMICFVIVWLHLSVVLHQVQSIERRCGEIPPARMDRIAKFRKRALYFPAILLALHWIGPIRWWQTGAWTPPPAPIGYILMGIGWLIVTGMLATTIKLMRLELTTGPHPRRLTHSA